MTDAIPQIECVLALPSQGDETMEQFRQRMEQAIEVAPNEQTKRSLRVLLDHCGGASTLDSGGGGSGNPPPPKPDPK